MPALRQACVVTLTSVFPVDAQTSDFLAMFIVARKQGFCNQWLASQEQFIVDNYPTVAHSTALKRQTPAQVRGVVKRALKLSE